MKNPLKSKTLWGSLILVAPWLLNQVGIKLSDQEWQTLLDAISKLAGLALVVWGRQTAKGPLAWPGLRSLTNLGLLLLVVAMTTAALGCASTEEKNAYLNAQLEALKLQKPILYLKAKPGEQITLGGLEELAVYQPLGGGSGGAGLIRQHQNEWAPVAREGLGIIGTVGGIYYGGQVAVQLADSIGRSAGTHITGAFNNSGPQSPINYYVGQGGAPKQDVADRHDSQDRHDVSGDQGAQ